MKTRKLKKAVLAISAGVMAIATGFFSSVAPIRSSAAAIVYNYDNTVIEQDLQDVDVLQYPLDVQGLPEVIRFQEYCYSEKPFFAESYGLYFYVYNPTEKEIRTEGNKANMAVAYDEKGEPTDFENVELTFLDATDNNRFLKFKVKDDIAFLTRVKAYAAAHNGERRYDIAGVQLYYKNGTLAKDVSISKTYRWTGFAAGMGEAEEDTSSLFCVPMETLQLEVHPTYFRTEAAGEHIVSQDSLHSVYFSVPNTYLNQYGALYEVEAEYLGAMLKPMLCTGNEDAYKMLLPYLGQDLSKHNEALNIMYAADVQKSDLVGFSHSAEYALNYYDAHFVLGTGLAAEGYNYITPINQDKLTALWLMFGTNSWTADSADTYIVPSSEIKKAMLASANDYGNVIAGAENEYSRNVFSSVDETYTPVKLTSEDKLDLTAEIIKQTEWWEQLFNYGGNEQTMDLFKDLQCVYQVEDKDITGNPAADSKRLCIALSDYEEFCAAYNKAKSNDETLFLFRYRVSQYESYEATLFSEGQWANIDGKEMWSEVDTNAYFFTQAVDLDFDIIDVTFKDANGTTVIPVVSDPIDFVPDGTPPNDTTIDGSDDDSGLPTWAWILIIIAVLAVIFFVKPVLGFVVWVAKGAVWLICLPFKGIAWLVERFSDGGGKGGRRK